MTANEFVKKLKSQIPSVDILIGKNISGEEIKNNIQPLLDLDIQSKEISKGDSIIDLLNWYDLSKVEIGMIVFNKTIIEDEEYFYIGKVEVDLLVINKKSGSIQVQEYDQPSHTLWNCARDSSSFLQALLVCNKFFWECLLDENVYNDESRRETVVEKCTYFAGGDTFFEFYAMLTGLEY
jgi:hypothetical protein